MTDAHPSQMDLADPVSLAAIDPARMARVSATTFSRIAAAWRLGNESAAQLLDISPRTFARMKAADWSGRLSRDQLMRISAVTGLYKALHLYFNDELADRWVTMRNTGPLFAGRSPLETMVEGGLPAILATRNYIDAVRGGA
ncbi:DUF2384 domain-containing protein [Hoeflea sp. YIM 152468]|uniref:antitoxin Xre-like helix-turn-helix domain-containing protein n=1 Tax=Hoeflea sp. YIM 152468 TaxID=3031759 RepID=UPI0023DA9B83|nr:antitoxin Xre-like helix-turn-helix domain-containing protein [Hoeflea sp. YIM 152468]MDF1608548.1 DUF2384 domain-containing protein [Hoeflea sp. YIM 152468]